MKCVRTYKDKKIKNRLHKVYREKWNRGFITVHTYVDIYPAGNIVTYTMSVTRYGEVIERNSTAVCNAQALFDRIKYYMRLSKEFEVIQ
ncbi:MAG: hypothetical protein ACTSWU_00875 [Candidatus Thorarchaeota archaeon]